MFFISVAASFMVLSYHLSDMNAPAVSSNYYALHLVMFAVMATIEGT